MGYFTRRRRLPQSAEPRLRVEQLEGREVPALVLSNFTLPMGPSVSGSPVALSADIINDQLMVHIGVVFDWGDQTPPVITEIDANPPTTLWQPVPTHTYTAAGTYIVTVTVDSVCDGAGIYHATATYPITVTTVTVPPTSPPPVSPPPPGPPVSPPPAVLSGNIIALPTDGSAGTHEGWVAENNDNDNYNFYGDPTTSIDQMLDRDELGQVVGEDDLIAIRVDPISGALAGDLGALHFTSPNIRIWPNADKNGWPIISDMPFLNPSSTTTLYVEGLNLSSAANAEKIDLLYVSADPAIQRITVSNVSLSVYRLTGPLNVPGYSKHTYEVIVPGANPATFGAVTGGTATSTSQPYLSPNGIGTAVSMTILWGEGEVVGKFKATAPNAFSVIRQVNVVKVQLDAEANSNKLVLDPTRQVQRGDKKGVQSSPNGNSFPAMYAGIRVTRIAGPVVGGAMRGMRFIDLGFMQTISYRELHGDYDDSNPKFQVVHRVEGKTYIDSVTPDQSPWYTKYWTPFPPGQLEPVPGFLNYRSLDTDNAVPGLNFDMKDSPDMAAVDELTVGGDHVDFYNIVVDFDSYFAVHTKDQSNAATDSYTIRGAVPWSWNASGRVTNDAVHTWTSTEGLVPVYSAANPKKLTEVTNGDVVSMAITKGISGNEALNNPSAPNDPKWKQVNQ